MQSAAKEIFLKALEMESPSRETYIEEASQNDPALRQEVQQLLEDAEKADSLFHTPAATPPVISDSYVAALLEKEGTQIGPYILRQKIGEGGFGVVWMAEQLKPITRMVAIKVVKAGMDTKQVLARFEAERQALAMMDHPNIAKVLDAGATDSGRPYFAMELVRGIPITEFCQNQKFDIRARLALFLDVCTAINHAHQKGIIHRDLKPSNIMVTLHGDQPVIKVIDFGIAKATQSKLTDKTLFTRFEQFLGSPVYMSPEQATLSGLDIDIRSDVYSLGILLYEILAGRPPYKQKILLSAGYDEMRRIIKEETPPPPSTLITSGIQDGETPELTPVPAASLKRELDWIIMKAIEKTPNRRYDNASAFAADIQRYLDDKPVHAAAPSKIYSIQKFARRHKTAFATGIAIAITLIAATGISTWLAIRAIAAEKRTAAEITGKEQALRDAESVTNFLQHLFESSDPLKDGRSVTVAETLGTAAKNLETELAHQPEQQARLRGVIGTSYLALGLPVEALSLNQKTYHYYKENYGPKDQHTLKAMGTLSENLYLVGKRAEAIQLREKEVKIRQANFPPNHPDTLRALTHLSYAYIDKGQYTLARGTGENLLKASIETFGEDHAETMFVKQLLSITYIHLKDRKKATELARECLKISTRLFGEEHPHTINNLSALGNAIGIEYPEQALELREKCFELSKKTYGPHNTKTDIAAHNLAVSYGNAERHQESAKILKDLVDSRTKTLGPNDPDLVYIYMNLSSAYIKLKKNELATAALEEGIRISNKAHGPKHPQTRQVTRLLANHLHAIGRKEESYKLFERLSKIENANP